jgi:NAD(P)-dependent dehydrogenase (short-subunit alcohol dehydrogenase family)
LTGEVANRRIIVSGGTSGIGLATAHTLADAGARVWIFGRTPETVQRALENSSLVGGSACDVADEAAVNGAVAEALGVLDGLDGAFVNAGMDGQNRNVLDLDSSHFRRVLDVNVLGVFHVARAAAQQMAAGSSIVVNASVNATRPEAAFADYNASKAAAVALAQTLALDLAERGIAVSALCPGYVRTRMTEPYLDDAETARELLRAIPAGRFGEPEEIARLVAFLLSSGAGYLTGSVITIDGGRSV